MQRNLKLRLSFSLIAVLFVVGFVFINQAKAQEKIEGSSTTAQPTAYGTRIVISASGPAKFSSFWLDDPARLVVKFSSRNIISKIDNEVMVNQGVIKRITSSYYGGLGKKSLKSLTFEFSQKIPYKIWQEGNIIILDLQTPLEKTVSLGGAKEIFTAGESSIAIVKRLEAMETALDKMAKSQHSSETVITEVSPNPVQGIVETEKDKVLPKAGVLPRTDRPKAQRNVLTMVLWFVGLSSFSGIGFLVWRRRKKRRFDLIAKLKSELQEKDNRLQQEETIRKAVEKAELQKEKDYQQLKRTTESLKIELEEKDERLNQKESILKDTEQASLEKEKKYQQLKSSFEGLQDVLVKKGIMGKPLSSEEKEAPWIPEKSKERRIFSRLALTKDFNQTIILRIESPNTPQNIKSFANNISSGGLCFEAKREFKEKEPINLKLFFYGDRIPLIKTQVQIIWKKQVDSTNYYGVSFDFIEEEDRLELKRYIDSKLSECTTYGTK